MLARLAGSWWARAALTAAILGWLATRIDMGAAARAVLRYDNCVTSLLTPAEPAK